MNKSMRLRALLHYGHFPEELPPPFNTVDFAKFRKSIGTAWAAAQQQYPKTSAEMFNVPRVKGVRRDLSIVNPIAQYHLSRLVSDNWVEIRNFLSSAPNPSGIDIAAGPDRAVATPEFAYIALKRAEIAGSYDHILISDISRFYSTLYTHTIPWAMHGKVWCKDNINNPIYHQKTGSKLDVAVRKGNDNQTMGIPVGPDTSRILSEILAVAIDKELIAKLDIPHNGIVRNVDDWCIGFDTTSATEDAISTLATLCKKYELDINGDKTSAMPTGKLLPSTWVTTLRDMEISKDNRRQGRDVEHYFNTAFHLADQYNNDNVLNFAVKRSIGMRITRSNWHRYETYLLRAIRSNPTTWPVVVRILASYKARGFSVGLEKCKKVIVDTCRKAAPNDRHFEVAWSLFLAKALQISLTKDELEPVCALESGTCALIALDLRSLGLAPNDLDMTVWQQAMNGAGLRSPNWMLSYEAATKGWMAGTTDYIGADPYFETLRSKGISFYDTRRNVKDIRSYRPRPISPALAALIAGIQIEDLRFVGGQLSIV